jgi:MFS family permease
MIGPLSGAIAVQLTAMTANFAVIAFTRLLEGLSTASAIPATLGYLSAITSKNESLRGRVMGIFEVATIGGTLGGVLIGGRLWDTFGRSAFTFDSGIYLISLAVFFFGITQTRNLIKRGGINFRDGIGDELKAARTALVETWNSLRESLSSPTILRFAPAWLAVNMILGAWFNSSIRQLVADNGRFPDQLLYGIFAGARAGTEVSTYAGAVLGIFAIGVVIWSLTFGRFRRTSVMLVGALGLFILTGFLFAFNHAGSLDNPLVPLYLGGALVGLLIISGFTPAALTYLADVTEDDPSDRGAIMGLYSVFFGIGQLFGTLLSGPFVDAAGMDGLIGLTALLGVLATFILIRLHQREARLAQQKA